ncbi:hypothetical protein COLO4_06745 [Corchorus olitorius]|uniref:Uncharacterized protein n=1 Tax=Corchorus olitorius TaxID=93759 RepID=A0A1R3KM33_9ROSI|nr:hypothetical protein COLO4_06745 [Corchorus olitorius]
MGGSQTLVSSSSAHSPHLSVKFVHEPVDRIREGC